MTLTHVVQYTLLPDDTDTRVQYTLPDDTDTRSAVYSTPWWWHCAHSLMTLTHVVQYTPLPDDIDTRSAVYSTPWWHWHT